MRAILFAMTLLAATAHADSLSDAIQTLTPELFAPGIIDGPAAEGAPAFSPDGKAVYFSRQNPAASTILVSHLRSGKWTGPEVAPFSGEWSDMEPAMSPDGKFLVFVSNRPAAPGGQPLDGSWNGTTFKAGGGNLWRVDQQGSGWGKPYRLPDVINRSASVFAPSIVADGSLYFMEPVPPDGKFMVYRSQLQSGTYASPQPAHLGGGTFGEFDPAVAPDESFVVFSSALPPAGPRQIDLFVAFRKNGLWDAPIHLGTRVNSPGSDAESRLGPDGHTLYFSSERVSPVTFPRTSAATQQGLRNMQAWDTGMYNIWRVDLSAVLAAGRADSAQILPAPRVFSPDVISAAGDPMKATFMPNGRSVYFTLRQLIAVSTLDGDRWSPPQTVSFSGKFLDIEPVLALDGSFLIFASNRPTKTGDRVLDGRWDNKSWQGMGGKLWRVDRQGTGWGEPKPLSAEVNQGSSVFTPTLARDGTLYFMMPASGGGHFQIYRSQPQGNGFKTAELLPFNDPRWSFEDPAVSPDESFVVFSSDRPPTAPGDLDLFIAFHQGGQWSEPIHLDSPISSAKKEIESSLGPDGHTLYFASRRPMDGDTDPKGVVRIWQVDLQPWLQEHRR